MAYEWDEKKRKANRAKHGVDFDSVVEFDWSTALIQPDMSADHDEFREKALGLIGERLHALVFVERDDAVRVISLRRATRKEMHYYAESR